MQLAVEPGVVPCGFAEQLNPWFRGPSAEHPNALFVGMVSLPGGTRRAHSYVKIFPARHRGQLVYNEVISHYLASQCGLPSLFTFPCACHHSLLRGMPLSGSDEATDFLLGVASLDGSHKEMKQAVANSQFQWADLMNWPHIARLAVFDELMGNDDRRLENLVRQGAHDYALIDNERILFGEPWFGLDLRTLRNKRCDANVLADTISEATDDEMKSRMTDIARRMVMATQLSAPEIADRLEKVCGAPSGTTERLIDMLNSRRTILPALMQWHRQKGDLFEARTNR